MPVAAAIGDGSVRVRLGVEDREPREQREVGDLELDLPLVVLDHGGHRHLAAGARGGGDAGERRDVERAAHAVGLARHEEEALLLARAAPMREHRVRHLRRVHHRAAAHRQEGVGSRLLGGGRAALDPPSTSPAGTSSKTPANSRPPSARPASTLSTRPVARMTGSVTTRTRLAPSFRNSKPVELEQVPPGDDPSGGGVLVEVLEAAQRRAVERRVSRHQDASSRSWRPPSSSSRR